MKTLVAFALLCAVAVQGQAPQPNPNQPGPAQPFPNQPGGTQPFQPTFPGGPFSFPGGQFPGGTGFPQQNPPQSIYSIDNNLGKRCVSGMAEWTAIIQGQADYDYARDLTDCPQPAPGQRSFTAKSISVYVIHVAGSPTAMCTFDRNLFLQQANANANMAPTPFQPSFGRMFPCPPDGNLDTSIQQNPPNVPGQTYPFGNPYGGNFGYWGGNFGGGYPGYGGVPSFGGGYGGNRFGPSVGFSAPGMGPRGFTKRK